MTLTDHIKPALTVVASACAGFFIGGRYVGSIAQPSTMFGKPNWIQTAQETMWIALGLCILCVVAWLWLDYRENGLRH